MIAVGAKIVDIKIVGSKAKNESALAFLSDIDELYFLARDKSHDSRLKLSCIIGSVLEADIPARENEIVADVLIGLLRQAEKDLRRIISEQISIIDNVPLRLVLQLANDDIEIANPILTNSNALGNIDLMYIIKSKTSEYWQAIAKREVLDNKVIDILSNTGDLDTALTLVENTNIVLTDHALLTLSDIAQKSEDLALPLLRRDEISVEVAEKLYKYVGKEIKKFITDNYKVDIGAISKAIDNSVNEFIETKVVSGFMPEDYMISAAKKFKSKDALNMSLTLSTLRLGHIRSFIAQFSIYTDVPTDIVCQLLSMPNGKGLALVSKAHGIKKQDFISIFMLSSKIWNQGSLVDMKEINESTAHYNNITEEQAIKIMQHRLSK